MGSKEVTYLGRLLSNGGIDHVGRAGAARLVVRALQAAKEAVRCGLPLRPLSGRGPQMFQLEMDLLLSLAALGAW